MNVITYFDKVRIINLERRVDRRRETEVEFQKHKFPINTEKSNFFSACAPKSSEGFPNPGVRGCFLSHLGVLEEALASHASNVLVLEDDIKFSKRIAEYDHLAIASLQGLDWDVAYFGHALSSEYGSPKWVPVKTPMLLAHFYAVNGKSLPKLIKFLHEILSRAPGHPDGGPMHYDGALNHFLMGHAEIKVFYYSKNLGHQRSTKTDLHKLSFIDTFNLFKPITIMFRKAKNIYKSLMY